MFGSDYSIKFSQLFSPCDAKKPGEWHMESNLISANSAVQVQVLRAGDAVGLKWRRRHLPGLVTRPFDFASSHFINFATSILSLRNCSFSKMQSRFLFWFLNISFLLSGFWQVQYFLMSLLLSPRHAAVSGEYQNRTCRRVRMIFFGFRFPL